MNLRYYNHRGLHVIGCLIGGLALIATACASDNGATDDPVTAGETTGEADSPTPDGDGDAEGEMSERVSLTVMSHSNLTTLPVDVAANEGFFDAEGLDVSITPTDADLARVTLLSGDAQAVTFSPSGSPLINESEPVVNLMALVNRSAWSLAVSSDLEDSVSPGVVDDLEGLEIGITGRGAGSDITLRQLIEGHGEDPDEFVQITPIGGLSESLSAIQEGIVDGAMLLEPYTSIGVEEGDAFIFVDYGNDAEIYPSGQLTVTSSVLMTRDYFDDNLDVARRFVRAVVSAMNAMAADPEIAMDTAAEFADDEEIMRTVLDRMIPLYAPTITEESWDQMMEDTIASGAIDDAPPYEDLVAVELQDIWQDFDPGSSN